MEITITNLEWLVKFNDVLIAIRVEIATILNKRLKISVTVSIRTQSSHLSGVW